MLNINKAYENYESLGQICEKYVKTRRNGCL